MTREIHDIPPAPRKVKWRAVLWHWWPVAFAGFTLGVYGGLITLMLFLARGGKQADDLLLDREGIVVTGHVTGVEGGADGRPIRLSYRYATEGGQEREGRSFLARPESKIDDQIDVEYARSEPHKSRAVGGKIALVPALHWIFFWAMLAPGLLCLGIWFIAVLRLRRLMMYGDIAVANLKATMQIRFVLPTMLHAVYDYRDHRATARTGSHWVRSRSALGERLRTRPTNVAVLHDRKGHGVSRLVMADDFVVQLRDPHDDSRRLHT